MDTGMLWFDDGPQALKDKVERAVSFYSTKYGRAPTMCLVHPVTLADGKEGHLAGVALQSSRSILPNHFLVGIEDRAASARKATRGRAGRVAMPEPKAA
ncbi:MAG: hypothetical protein A2Z17_06045 [Gammaproteobacteria bacterium RBG_16_66_13]|nr:MAG: hypothetical protein A2Z17_06045 [Gammaproteobacteria bacterium RBG_16_66_13]